MLCNDFNVFLIFYIIYVVESVKLGIPQLS